MTREEALVIAKNAYNQIIDVIEELEVEHKGKYFSAYWDECIGIDEWLFHGHELRGES